MKMQIQENINKEITMMNN